MGNGQHFFLITSQLRLQFDEYVNYLGFIIQLAVTRENHGCVLLCKIDWLLLFIEYKQINKGGCVFGSLGLSVCLWITLLKNYERIWMKFYGDVLVVQ